MTEAAEHIYEKLNEPTIANALTGGSYWELAEEDADLPFGTFSVSDQGPVTKGLNMMQYEVKVRVFADGLKEASNIMKIIRTSVRQNTSWRDRGARSGYTDAEAKEAFIEITYDFKL